MDQIDRNPPLRDSIVAVLLLLGAVVLTRGIGAMTNRRLYNELGSFAHGASAELLGVVYIVAGCSLGTLGVWLRLR